MTSMSRTAPTMGWIALRERNAGNSIGRRGRPPPLMSAMRQKPPYLLNPHDVSLTPNSGRSSKAKERLLCAKTGTLGDLGILPDIHCCCIPPRRAASGQRGARSDTQRLFRCTVNRMAHSSGLRSTITKRRAAHRNSQPTTNLTELQYLFRRARYCWRQQEPAGVDAGLPNAIGLAVGRVEVGGGRQAFIVAEEEAGGGLRRLEYVEGDVG